MSAIFTIEHIYQIDMRKIFILVLLFLCLEKFESNGQVSSDIVSQNDTCRKIDTYLSELEAKKNFSGALLIVKNGEKISSQIL